MTQALIFFGTVLFLLPFFLLIAIAALTKKATPKPDGSFLSEAKEPSYADAEAELVA